MNNSDLYVGFAADREREELMRIWRTSFGDSAEYVRFFFDAHPLKSDNGNMKTTAPDCILSALYRGKPVGMTALLPVEYVCGNTVYPSFYIYALCVDTDYRHRGIAASLLSFALAKAQYEGGGLLLRPGSAGLSEYYRGLGFLDAFYAGITEPDVEELPASNRFTVTDISPEEFASEMYASRPCDVNTAFTRWNSPEAAYAASENLFCGGFCRRIGDGVTSYVALGHTAGGVTEITDSTLTSDIIQNCAYPLLASEGNRGGKLRAVLPRKRNEPFIITGMAKGVPVAGNGFLSLSMQ